uniref:EamA domain-containing protein n=1 Tax=Calcidiscus leptoporus TaxID=127549 RepID=A0A7S0JFC2_9EUKA
MGGTRSTTAGLAVSWRVSLGLFLLVLQCVSFVALVLVQKPLVSRYPVPWVVAWSYILCTMWSSLAALLDGSMLHVRRALSSPSGFAIIAYSATLGCVVYFMLIAYASRHLSSTLVSVTVSLEPLAVSAIGVLFFEQTFQRLELAGYAIAFTGSAMLAFATREPAQQATDGGRGAYELTGLVEEAADAGPKG